MISLFGLRTFDAVVETGSIRAAADRIGRTPSAVSMMLKQLEGEVGGALFAGDRKNVLSELGTRVHGEAKPLLEHYERASAAMVSFASGRIGRCDVASVPSVAMNFLPEAIARVRMSVGRFSIQVRDMDSRAVVDAVEGGVVEVGVCVLPRARPGLIFEPLFREALDLVCRHDHPLAKRGELVSWDEIDAATFISNGSAATITSERAKSMVKSAQLRARNVTSILAMVRAGLGVSILPRLCSIHNDPDVVFLPIDDKAAERTVGWIKTTERNILPATAHLVRELRNVIRHNSRSLGAIVLE